MIDFFTQNGLNMMVVYVSIWPKSVCVLISVDPSNSISRGKNNLFSDDLLQRIDDTMFDNSFVN